MKLNAKSLMAHLASIAVAAGIGAASLGVGVSPAQAYTRHPYLRSHIRHDRQDIRQDRRQLQGLAARHRWQVNHGRLGAASVSSRRIAALRAHVRNDRRDVRVDRWRRHH